MAGCIVSFILSLFCIICEIADTYSYDDKIFEEAANYLKEGFNETAEPCQNFSNFACGKWLKSIGNKSVEPGSHLANLVRERLTKGLSEIELDDKDTQTYKKSARLFHDKCTDSNIINERFLIKNAYQALTKLRLIPSMKLFPVDDKSNQTVSSPTVADLKDLWYNVGLMHRYLPEVKMIFKLIKINLRVGIACKREETYILFVVPVNMDEFNMSVFQSVIQHTKNATYRDNEKVAQFYELDRSIRNLAPHNFTEIKSLDETNKVNGQTQDCYNLEAMNIEQVVNKIPNIPWLSYFKGLLNPTQFDKIVNSNARVLNVDHVVQHLTNLNEIFSKFKPDRLFDYLFYIALNDSVHTLREYHKTEESLQNKCAQLTEKLLPSASVKIVFDNLQYNPILWNSDLSIVFETVKAAFIFFVSSSDWLYNRDKVYLIDRANSIKFISPVQAWFNNETEIDARTLSVDSNDDYILIFFKCAAFKFDLFIDKVLLGNETEEEQTNLDVFAGYHPLFKIIMLKVGIALPPMYHPDYPLAMKYGIIGFIIGHEIMHGFHIEGELAQHLHLQPETLKIFKMKMQCLQKQYSASCYDSHERCLDGVVTQNENMADVDGLKIAYMAYKFAAQTISKEAQFSHELFHLNHDQLFYLANARWKCSTGKEISEILETNDPHPPFQTRMDVPLKNFPVFASVFNCTKGTFYAPTYMCSVLGSFSNGEKFKKL